MGIRDLLCRLLNSIRFLRSNAAVNGSFYGSFLYVKMCVGQFYHKYQAEKPFIAQTGDSSKDRIEDDINSGK